jgi:hypothetical protein
MWQWPPFDLLVRRQLCPGRNRGETGLHLIWNDITLHWDAVFWDVGPPPGPRAGCLGRHSFFSRPFFPTRTTGRCAPAARLPLFCHLSYFSLVHVFLTCKTGFGERIRGDDAICRKGKKVGGCCFASKACGHPEDIGVQDRYHNLAAVCVSKVC